MIIYNFLKLQRLFVVIEIERIRNGKTKLVFQYSFLQNLKSKLKTMKFKMKMTRRGKINSKNRNIPFSWKGVGRVSSINRKQRQGWPHNNIISFRVCLNWYRNKEDIGRVFTEL